MSSLSEVYAMYFNGPEGETLFHRPFLTLDRDYADAERMWKRMEAHKDDRSMVLMAALVCEEYIDRLLAELMPHYNALLKSNRDFTFSTKIKLLESFRVIPLHLTRAADLVRAVRNEFAHKLDLDTLQDLDAKVVRRLRALYVARKIRTELGPDDIHNLFDWIAYMATTALISYRQCLVSMSAAIRNPEFASALHAANRDQHRAFLAEMRLGQRRLMP